MPANYVLLEKISVGAAGASSVTFSGIPQTGYTDLIVNSSTRASAGSDTVGLQFNGDTGSNYTYRRIRSDGSTVTSGTGTAVHTFGGTQPESTFTANTFSNCAWYIPNYTSSNNKSLSADAVSENNATSAQAQLTASLWSNTAAITSITVIPGSGSFVQYSTFYLYGVAKLGTTPAIVPYATGGDTIMTDGTYWYHTFLSSGTFTPAKALTCDYLVVAGGGSGGNNRGAGGGAGGLRSTVTATGGGGALESKLSLASGTGYTVTIGAGGATQTTSGFAGNDGSNSVFSTITSTGGGGGGGNSGNTNGRTGGSGGGGGHATNGIGGAGTANQGYAGGSVTSSSNSAAGGGGANAVGTGTSGLNGGAGGSGVATSITGSSVTYAGGGGGGGYSGTGGAGGSGGGGAGASESGSVIAVAGTANLGGGGGGGTAFSQNGAAGGSGIVIVRYAV